MERPRGVWPGRGFTTGLLAATLALLALSTGLARAVPTAPVRVATAESTPGLLYDFHFANSTGTVSNAAGAGPVTKLTLLGDWSLSGNGVHFAGNTTGKQSVAHGVPASGDSLNAPATKAVGVRARIRYFAPSTGTCFGDTPNITQIGRFASHEAQAKIQLSKCADSKTHVVVQCRFAGSLTPISVDPVSSTLHLIGGDSYTISCMKAPDRANGTAIVTLIVTNLNASTAAQNVTNKFTVSGLGAMTTKQAISAGNKYPLPSPANNTDQFVGNVARVIYCVGSSSVVSACLAS
jgi:hypothetical protein